MATLSLQDLAILPPAQPQRNVLSLDDLAKLDPKQTSSPQGPMSWGDVATGAVMNLPSSAYNVGAGLVHAVAHPIDTAQGIYDLGKGAVSKAAGAIGIEQDPQQKAQDEAGINALKDFYVNRYGSMEGFKKALAEDPAGVAMDLSSVFTGGETALARIPGATRAASAVGKAAEITNPVNIAGKVVTGVPIPLTGLRVGIAPALSNVLGETTGVGAQPLRQAFQAGKDGNTVFTDHMRGNAPMSDAVDMGRSATGQMRAERNAQYQADMAAANASPGHVGYQPIHQAIQDAENMVNYNQGGVSLTKDDGALSTLQAIKDKVNDWRGLPNPYTVEAADALKQAIGGIYNETKPNTVAQKVAKSIYNAAKSAIVQQAPEYANAMKGYSESSDLINEIERGLSLGQRASADTALRKLQSTTRNNVTSNYGNRTRMLDELAQYEPDLPNALAGQALTAATPRGLAGKIGAIGIGANGVAMHGLAALNPQTLALLPFFSPRVMGEAAYGAGRTMNALAPAMNALPATAKAGYVINALSQPQGLRGGIGPRYDANGNLLPGQ